MSDERSAPLTDDELRERVWQNMIAECPELEHAVLEIPERRPSWWRRLLARLGLSERP